MSRRLLGTGILRGRAGTWRCWPLYRHWHSSLVSFGRHWKSSCVSFGRDCPVLCGAARGRPHRGCDPAGLPVLGSDRALFRHGPERYGRVLRQNHRRSQCGSVLEQNGTELRRSKG
uniref:(northern house mosquito) hypothetical protein n=1 Tax=Culex pipiens TaxID=7175 RepID=A0A8D8MZK9_CULPI